MFQCWPIHISIGMAIPSQNNFVSEMDWLQKLFCLKNDHLVCIFCAGATAGGGRPTDGADGRRQSDGRAAPGRSGSGLPPYPPDSDMVQLTWLSWWNAPNVMRQTNLGMASFYYFFSFLFWIVCFWMLVCLHVLYSVLFILNIKWLIQCDLILRFWIKNMYIFSFFQAPKV